MKTPILFFVMLSFSIFNTGCMAVNLTAVGYDKTASLTNTEKKFTIVKHFNRDIKNLYTLFNLIPLSEPSLADLLHDETMSSHGDAVINLRIHGQTSLLDMAIPLSLGVLGSIVLPPRGAFLGVLIGSRTYTVEGDVIKYIE